MQDEKKINLKSVFSILLLILAGEAVFILPFVLQRIFRPTFLETFAINNTQIGSCFSVYGIVALISYLLGGPLADKFKPNLLMAVALILTGFGGFYLSTYPSILNLHLLYGFWGFTTIFLFWAAMIKATRIWGGQNAQGMAFGLLDGGRGLVAALFGSAGVFVFAYFLTEKIDVTTLEEKRIAFKQVINYSSVAVCLVGVLVFLFLRNLNTNSSDNTGEDELSSNKPQNQRLKLSDFKSVIKYRSVWLLMIIIMCAYFSYKMTDVFSLYANQVMLFDEVESAKIGTYLLYLRPLFGIIIGLLADRTRASLWLIIGFSLILVISILFSLGVIESNLILLFGTSIAIMALGVYSLRTLYFAVLEESKIPLAVTGTAIGVISVVGYTPDIFSGPLIGYFLDTNPGALGLQHSFGLMAGFALVGLFTSIYLMRYNARN
ncbi:MAG: MFS transporter [Bacteroidota bacterium]